MCNRIQPLNPGIIDYLLLYRIFSVFQRQHKWLVNSNLTLSSWDTSHDTNITVTLSGIQLRTCYWNIWDLNLNIIKSILPSLTMNISKTKSNNQFGDNYLVSNIDNSSIKHLVGSSINLHVSNVFIIDPKQSNQPVFMLENSVIEFVDSRFHGVQISGFTDDSAVLHVNNSKASIKYSDFSSNSAPAGIIASANSRISVCNCKFQQNKGVNQGALFVTQSSVSLMSSEFKWNQAIQGGALKIQDSSDFTIDNCIFYSNKATGPTDRFSVGKLKRFKRNMQTAQPYPVLYWHGNLDLGNITHSGDIFQDREDGVQALGGAILGGYNVTITITESKFIGNKALSGLGGAIYVIQSSVSITATHFKWNRAVQNGVLTILAASNVTINACKFYFNKATGWTFPAIGGAILASQNVTINIAQSEFIGNSAVGGLGGAICVHQNVIFTTTQSEFIGNTAAGGQGGAICVFNNSQLEVHSSLFTNNTAFQGGAIEIQQNVNATFTNTSFITNSVSANSGQRALNNGTQQQVDEHFSSSDKKHSNITECLKNLEYCHHGKVNGSGSNKQNRGKTGSIEGHPSKQVFTRCNGLAPKGGAIDVDDDVMIHIQTSMFIKNTADTFGGALHAANNVTSHIEDSVFDGSSAEQGGAMNVQENVKMTIMNTEIANNKADLAGGVLASLHVDLHIINCGFLKNSAQQIGALFISDVSNYTVTNSLFINNTGYQYVAAINVQYDSTGCIVRCNFSGNTGAYGSDIRVYQSVMNVSHVSFTNVSPNIIYLTSSSQLYMSVCTIKNNSLKRSTQGNDDIFLIEINKDSNAHITKCNIMYNDFPKTGLVNIETSTFYMDTTKIMCNDLKTNLKVLSGFLSMRNVNISVNNVSNSGGVIDSENSKITLTDCRVNNNSAGGWGGVIFSTSGNISIWNSSFLFNSARGNGGVISLYSEGYSSLSVANTLFHHNHAEGYGAVIHAQRNDDSILIDIALDSCLFQGNTTQSDSALYLDGGSFLRTSRCHFETASQSPDKICSIYLFAEYTNTYYLTYRTQFHIGNTTLNSSSPHFLQKAVSAGIIVVDGDPKFTVMNEETSYATGEHQFFKYMNFLHVLPQVLAKSEG